MGHPFEDDEEWHAEESEVSGDEWDEGDGGDDQPTIPCPYCKRPIHEDAERCSYCEQYVSREDAPPGRKPWWIIAGAALCLYAVYRWVVG